MSKASAEDYERRKLALIDSLARSNLDIEISTSIAVSDDVTLKFFKFRIWAFILLAVNFAIDAYQVMHT